MAEFKTVMREFQRLCSERKCGSCPVGNRVFNERESYCCIWVKDHPEEAERIVMQWAAEHPLITNAMKFYEVFGQPCEHLFAVGGIEAQWLSQEYKGGQNENN